MVSAVQNALISPVQQPAAAKSSSGNNDADPASENNTEESADAVTGSKNQSPLAPESFNALLEAQEGKEDTAFGSELTEEEEKIVRELKKTDQEVRAHEQAHKTAGGPYAVAISYDTTTGPDGRQYAVGGEVQIDTSPIPGNPEATIRKLEVVIRAALAPSDPSPQDMAVAAQAQQAKLQAQQELREQRAVEQEELREKNKADPTDPDAEKTARPEPAV